MFEKMYIEGDRKFKKRRFILLLIFNIAAFCVMNIAAYSEEFETMTAAFLIQIAIFMISASYVKKYEEDIAGEENYAKTKIYALVFIAVKIAAMIFSGVIVTVITRITENAAASLLIALPDIIGYIAMAVALGFIATKLKKKGAVYNKYRLIVYAFNIAAVPWFALQVFLTFIVFCFH